MLLLQQSQYFGRVSQAELLESGIGQDTAPTVKNHHGLSAGFNLGVQIAGDSLGVDLQNAVHQIGSAVEHGLHQAVIVRAFALDHVAGQGPGAARKTNKGHAAIQGFADGCHGIKDITQLGHVGHLQLSHGGFVAHRLGKARAFAQGKAQTQAHGVWHGQDVAEQNGRIQRVAL